MKKKLVVLTGAGISAESGIKTFRDSDGLWENYRIEDVATYNGWIKNKQLVLDFYNGRHKELKNVEPNAMINPKANWDWNNTDGNIYSVGGFILAIISMIILIVSLCNFNEMVTGFINPEFGAMQDIVGFFK